MTLAPEADEQLLAEELFDEQLEGDYELEFDDDDDDDEELNMEVDDDDFEFDYDDEDEEFGMDDDDDDEEFLGAALGGLGAAVAPVLINQGARLIGKHGPRLINRLVRGGRRRKRRRLPRARNWGRYVRGTNRTKIMTRRGPISARFTKRFVTTTQLRAALGGVRKDINRVSSRIGGVDRRLRKSISSVGRTAAAAVSAEARKRAIEMRKLKKRVDKRFDDMTLLNFMMSQNKNDGAEKNQFQKMLPLLLLSGGLDGKGDDSSDLLMLMVLSGNFK